MAGIFPKAGLAPGVQNTGVDLLIDPPVGCDALYYNELCAQKVDPAAFNAMISEMVAIVNACNTLQYDCTRRDNVLMALQCLFALPPCPQPPGCYELRCVNNIITWVNCTEAAGAVGYQSFEYIGSDQIFTIPAGVTSVKIQAWGAAGAGHAIDYRTTTCGGPGGYTEAVFPATGVLAPGAQVVVMVGGSPQLVHFGYSALTPHPADPYGFGANGHSINNPDTFTAGFAGGGLSGVFSTSALMTAGGAARSIVVAGGGGGGSDWGFGDTGNLGGPGNHPLAGGAPTLAGVAGTPAGSGGGGGGYAGGTKKVAGMPDAGLSWSVGGTGFVMPGSTSSQILYSTPGSINPPMISSPYYNGHAGSIQQSYYDKGDHGLVVISWS